MATITPFKAIRPNPLEPHQLSYTAMQTASVAFGATPDELTLKVALETVARQRPESVEGQAAAYAAIKESLQAFLDTGQLLQDEKPGLFIYEVMHEGVTQTGVWALTDLKDYNEGRIRIHELTFAESTRRLHHYRQATGLEGSPVLLTYRPSDAINQIITAARRTHPDFTLGYPPEQHRLWKIEDEYIIMGLVKAFAHINHVYLADGHHRLSSAAQLAAEQKVNGDHINSTLTSLYMATDQLQIGAYHRVVVPDQALEKVAFFRELTKFFYVMESYGNRPVQPRETHKLGLLLEGEWYHLTVKPSAFLQGNLSDCLDAAILQKKVLAPVFGIADPKTDQRLRYAGGADAMTEIMQLCADIPSAVAFTLAPLTTDELMAVADAGEILPPKSTWIYPKVPYGLLLYQYQPDQ